MSRKLKTEKSQNAVGSFIKNLMRGGNIIAFFSLAIFFSLLDFSMIVNAMGTLGTDRMTLFYVFLLLIPLITLLAILITTCVYQIKFIKNKYSVNWRIIASFILNVLIILFFIQVSLSVKDLINQPSEGGFAIIGLVIYALLYSFGFFAISILLFFAGYREESKKEIRKRG